MKRFFAVTGFSAFITLLVASFLPFGAIPALVLVLALLFVLCCFWKHQYKKRVLFILVCAIISLAWLGAHIVLLYSPLAKLKGQEIQLRGYAEEKLYNEGEERYYKFRLQSINSKSFVFPVYIELFTDKPLELLEEFTAPAKVFEDISKVTSFHKNLSLSSGCFVSGYVNNNQIEYTDKAHGFKKWFYHLREKIQQVFLTNFPTLEGEITAAAITGDKSSLDTTLKGIFKINGVTHLFAVSGLHLSILTGLFSLALRKCKVKKLAACIINCIFILLFMALMGFTASVTRAGIMLLFMQLAFLFSRESDGLNSLGFAVFLQICLNPFVICQLSFLLSVCATAGILLLAGPIEQGAVKVLFKEKLTRGPIHTFKIKDCIVSITRGGIAACSVSIAACLFTFPISLVFFGGASFIAPLTNTLIAPVIPVFIGCGMICGIIGLFPPLLFLSRFFGVFAIGAAFCIRQVCSLLAKLPFIYLSAERIDLFIWTAGSALLFGIALSGRHRKKLVKTAALFSLIAFVAAISSEILFSMNTVEITIAGSKEGKAPVAICQGKNILLFASGGKDAAVKYIAVQPLARENNIRTMVGLGQEKEDIQGYIKLCEALQPKKLLLPQKAWEEPYIQKYTNTNCCDVLENSFIRLDENFQAEIRADKQALAVFVEVQGVKILIEQNYNIDALPAEWTQCDIFIIQGDFSKNYEKIRYKYVIINNNYQNSDRARKIKLAGSSALFPAEKPVHIFARDRDRILLA